MKSCPAPDDLASLLSDGPVGPDRDALRAHVHGCSRCQALLDILSDDQELGRSSSRGAGPRLDPRDCPALARLMSTLLAARPWRPPSAEAPGRYAFLGPPRREGDLGTIGPYPITAELGRGGMGIVLLGHDEALQRSVAVKVLRPERADEASRRQFVPEARAAARVRHDHIVGVHGVGDPPGGPPYLVLEYMAGPSLAGRLRQEGRLSPRDAAVVAAQVAAGLAAAHAVGLVHRDVKPANILFDPDDSRAKLADFGLARVAAADGPTCVEGLAGTPAYMSPEQARGEVVLAPASDIYALGATLYAALTGTPPFCGAAHAVLKRLQDDEPTPPRKLNDAVPRDLEAICLKCLEKDPRRRYDSAVALAEDLRRFLAGEPTIARPVPAWERWFRRARRRPAVALLAIGCALMSLALVAGGVAYVVGLRAANGRAEGSFRRAFAAVNRTLTRVGSEDLSEIPELELVRRSLLADALSILKDLESDPAYATDPRAQSEVAASYKHMAAVEAQLGEIDRAVADYEAAIERLGPLVARFPGRRPYLLDLADCHEALGRMLDERLDRRRAESHLRHACDLLGPLAGEPDARIRLPRCYGALARIDFAEGRLPAAEGLRRKAAELLERQHREAPSADTADGLARALFQLGHHALFTGRHGESVALLRRALAVWEPWADDGRGSRRQQAGLAECYTTLAHAVDAREAEALWERALAIRQRLARRFPNTPEAGRDLANAHHSLGGFFYGRRRWDRCEENYERARAILDDLVIAHPGEPLFRRRLAESCQNLALVQQATGRRDLAATTFGVALGRVQELRRGREDDIGLAQLQVAILTNRGNLHQAARRCREALADLDEAVELGGRVLDAARGNEEVRGYVRNAHGSRAQALEVSGRFAESVGDWDRVIALDAPSDRGVHGLARGKALARAGRHAAAAIEARRVVSDLGKPGVYLYHRACILALSARAARDDEGLAEPRRVEVAEGYAREAVALLERARRAGYFGASTERALLDSDPELKSLRGRPDFQLLRMDSGFPADPFSR